MHFFLHFRLPNRLQKVVFHLLVICFLLILRANFGVLSVHYLHVCLSFFVFFSFSEKEDRERAANKSQVIIAKKLDFINCYSKLRT